MPVPTDILSDEQIKNYYATLRIALSRLNENYAGKMMNIPIAGFKDATRLHKILDFYIIPVEKGGSKKSNLTELEHILMSKNVIDLLIMVRYTDNKGNEGLIEINSFLAANDITKL